MKQLDNSFEKFLINAKKQTYANSNIKEVASLRPRSKDYHYEEDNFVYHDTYFGGTNFIGEEVVYKNDHPIWAMNYRGVTLDDNKGEAAMDAALRPALMKVGEDNILPLRGPKEFHSEKYKYTFDVDGNMSNFSGVEKIFKDDKLVYELKCEGGIIK